EDISWATIATDEPYRDWWWQRCTVWYRFVPTEDADMVVRAVGEGFSPAITIFSGSCSSPTYVSYGYSDAYARVTAGQTYLIQVGSQSETAGPLTVSVAKAPDLVMNAVSGPAQASPGQRISVSRSVANVGAGPATGLWYDAFYLSSDDQLDVVGDYNLGYVERVRELNPGEGYDGPGDNLMIPANTPPGLYWILGDTDHWDHVWEGVGEGNNGRKSDTRISVVVDTTPPTVPVITQPNGGEHISGGASYVISWTPSSDDIISPEEIRIRLEFNPEFNDDSGWTLIEPEAPNTGSFFWNVPLVSSTSCRVRATAIDLAGNESQPDESDSDFTIDSTPPSVPVVIQPNGGEAYAAGTTQQITWTPPSDNLTSQSEIAITVEVLDSEGWSVLATVPNTGQYDWAIPSWVDNADARIRLTAIDQAGNTSAPDESDAGFLIDNQGPALQITQGPDENAWQQANTAHFEWDATDNHSAHEDIRYSYSTDGQTWTDWSSTTSVDLSSLADGWQSLQVKAKDTVGNENMVVRSFGVDATPPTNPVVTDDGQCTTATDSLHATWYSYDPASPIAEYTYAVGTSPTDPGSGYVVEWTSAGTATEVTAGGLSLQEGPTYYFYVKARDTVGLESGVGVSDGIEVRTTPLQVTDVTVSELGHTAATIIWTTNQPATSQVDYGLTDSYGESTGCDLTPTTSHEVALSGLSPETLYHFRVKSDDGCQEAMSADNTFTTETAPLPDLHV
ncbi:MAG: fibronectin type III domain-containing protein, partial [Armatimonadetes bacterium]|nr:fibronectin type III domain-containing protein [Armatimonadota bacterium]